MNEFSWIRLPLKELQKRTPSASIIYAVMLDRCVNFMKKELARVEITTAELQGITGLSRATIFRALAELETAGLIEDKCRTGRATIYIIKRILPPKKRGQYKEE